MASFNKKNEYDSLIADKVMELKRLCHMYKMPMFVTVCVKNTESETEYEKEMISAVTCGYELTDNQITKHVNVSLGFDTVQPKPEETLEVDAFEGTYIEEEEKEKE